VKVCASQVKNGVSNIILSSLLTCPGHLAWAITRKKSKHENYQNSLHIILVCLIAW
jgi:hypothetical protein